MIIGRAYDKSMVQSQESQLTYVKETMKMETNYDIWAVMECLLFLQIDTVSPIVLEELEDDIENLSNKVSSAEKAKENEN